MTTEPAMTTTPTVADTTAGANPSYAATPTGTDGSAAPPSGSNPAVVLRAWPAAERQILVIAEADRVPAAGRAFWFFIEVPGVDGGTAQFHPVRQVAGARSSAFRVSLPSGADPSLRWTVLSSASAAAIGGYASSAPPSTGRMAPVV